MQLGSVASGTGLQPTRKNNSMLFVILKLENDEMIGTVGFEHINQINKSATLDIMRFREEKSKKKKYALL